MPPLVMLNVPPTRSSMASFPVLAFSASATMPFSMPPKLRPSTPRSTGTTRPLGVETAMPKS